MLNRSSLVPRISEKQFEDYLVKIAERSFKNDDKYRKDFAHVEDGEVRYIAHYLKAVTRQSDKKDYFITYRELSNILKRFGFELCNVHSNCIDITRENEDGSLQKIGTVGCHGMTKQVPKGIIKQVRKLTDLDLLGGVDSAAFYRGEEPLINLLAKYYDPLERLAFR